jgi:hypothetical protein
MFSPKYIREKSEFDSNYCSLGRKKEHKLGFQEKRHFIFIIIFFLPKLGENRKSSHRHIDPWIPNPTYGLNFMTETTYVPVVLVGPGVDVMITIWRRNQWPKNWTGSNVWPDQKFVTCVPSSFRSFIDSSIGWTN